MWAGPPSSLQTQPLLTNRGSGTWHELPTNYRRDLLKNFLILRPLRLHSCGTFLWSVWSDHSFLLSVETNRGPVSARFHRNNQNDLETLKSRYSRDRTWNLPMKVNSKKDGEFEKLYFMKSSRWRNVTALSHYIDQEEDYNIAHFSFWFESGPARVMIAVTERDPGWWDVSRCALCE